MRARREVHSNEATLEPVVSKLEGFVLYETTSHLYLTACDKLETQYRVLKIDRRVTDATSLADICQEDPIVYTPQDMLEMLEMINEGNRNGGGLRLTAKGYGIVGFVKFLDCYYLNFITQRKMVGAIGGNLIYAVKATEMFAIKPADSMAGALSSEAQSPDSNAFVNTWSKVNRRLNPTPREIAEARYLGLFQFIDLTKDFFYSYTYDLTNSLQHNMTAATSKTFPPPPFKDMYAWNFHQTRELEAQVGHLNSSFWVLPIIHGAFLQRKVKLSGRMLNITVIARRSRHFAGTRYLKRGVSDTGNVANDVEVEQIVHAEAVKEGVFSSFVQMRGSIPIFWTQESSMTLPKPPIVLSRVDPMYTATQAHFADLLERYSSPLLVLDLVKQNEKRDREVIVGHEYSRAVAHVNSTMPAEHMIRYCALDFSHMSKHRNKNVLAALEKVAEWTLAQVGFFCSAPQRTSSQPPEPTEDQGPVRGGEGFSLKNPRSFMSDGIGQTREKEGLHLGNQGESLGQSSVTDESSKGEAEGVTAKSQGADDSSGFRSTGRNTDPSPLNPPLWGQGFAVMPMEQHGVLRTNCIDCLDRTNVGQFSVGMYALGRQLFTMGVSNGSTLDPGSQVVLVLMEIYTELGDHIALQYGGSEAHKKVSTASSGPSKQVGSNKHRELLTSIRRYYSNAFTDRVKQDAMNLFLGYFTPTRSLLPLWELDSDYYLHNFHVESAGLQSMREYKKDEYFLDQDEELPGPETKDDLEDETTIGFRGHWKDPMIGSDPGTAALPVATTLSGMIDEDRIAETQLKGRRVRRMCARQRAAMSQWWRDALQRYAQKRMWMHLGPPKQGQLPPRYERIYEPHRLTEFDKHFSYGFAVPVPEDTDLPGQHAAAHGGKFYFLWQFGFLCSALTRSVCCPTLQEAAGREAGVTISRYTRGVSESAVKAAGNLLGRSSHSVGGTVGRSGTESKAREPDTLEAFGGSDHERWRARNVAFIGTAATAQPEATVASYASIAHEPHLLLATNDVRELNREEVSSYLEDFTLGTDTAEEALAVQRLGENHCCTATVTFGPYQGLQKGIAARRVAAAVVERLQQLGWAMQYGLDMRDQWEGMEQALQDAGIDVMGVKQEIRTRLEEELHEQARLEAIIDSDILADIDSTLTSEESLDTYCSFFEKYCTQVTVEKQRNLQENTSAAGVNRNHTKEDSEKSKLKPFFTRSKENVDLFVMEEIQSMRFNDVGKNHAARIFYGN
ncbi:unnamed protein product [Discosporangium mesarthrocarpum]